MKSENGLISLTAAVAGILPSTCVCLANTIDFGCRPAVTGDFPFGIAQEYTEYAPGTPWSSTMNGAAINVGEALLIYGPGAIAKAAVKRNSDFISAGRPVGPSTSSELIVVASGPSVGWLLESGTAGQSNVLRVFVHPHTVTGTEGSGS
jgi:hypothetical protein